MTRILILENDVNCIEFYKSVLDEIGEIHFVKSLTELENKLASEFWCSILIADLDLPDGSFLQWVGENRSDLMLQLSTIIVSTNDRFHDLNHGFELGATDCIVKPFRENELKVKALKALGFIDLKKCKLTEETHGIMEGLTMIEGKIFQIFLKEKNKFVTRNQITSSIWNKINVHPKTLNVHMSNLRKKITDSGWWIEQEDEKGWKLSRKN